MKIDKYDLFYVDVFDQIDDLTNDKQEYELFISAYNNEEMVHNVYSAIEASKKIWLILPDYYDIDPSLVNGDKYQNNFVSIHDADLESSYINDFLKQYNLGEYIDKNICIDITGFVKPYMIYLLLALKYIGFTKVDILYTEPKIYQNQEDTEFSEQEIISTRSINSFFDKQTEEGADDLFIVNAGYDYRLLINIAGYKKYIKTKKVLLGFPSLQPIMFQENILNLQKSSSELDINNDFKPLYAAANDPFDTAKVIKNYIESHLKKVRDLKTIYLAPLATKAQTLGMLLFYILEEEYFLEKGINIIIVYPFTKSYSSSSGKELFKINRYTIEM